MNRKITYSLALSLMLLAQPAFSQDDGFSDEDGFDETEQVDDGFEEEQGFDEMGCDPDFDEDCRPGRETQNTLPEMEVYPLNPAGYSLDILLKKRLNDGLWDIILGDLPCADLSSDCVRDLQNSAVMNSLALQEIDLRIEEAQMKIDEARANSKKSVLFETFSPALQYYLGGEASSFPTEQSESYQVEVPTTEVVQVPKVVEVPTVVTVPVEVVDPETGQVRIEQRQEVQMRQQVENKPELRQTTKLETRQRTVERRSPGALDRILADIANPIQLANNLLNLVGIPFLENILGGSDKAQSRAIAISDLQIKVAELQRSRAEIAQALREKVVEILLVTDAASKEFQIAQEIGLRDTNRLAIARINYQFGEGDSESYLAKISALDRQKAQVLRNFNQMRSSLEKLRVIVNQPE